MQLSKDVLVHTNLDDYRSFFDHAWSGRFLAQTDDTPLTEVAFDLVLAWRYAANTHCLPWLMVQQLKSFGEGFARTHEPFTQKVVAAIAATLSTRMSKLTVTKRKEMERILGEITADVRTKVEQFDLPIDAAAYWNDLLPMSEFQFSVLGSQRLCYGAIYYAYEDFVWRTYKAVSGDASDQMPKADEFVKRFKNAFGQVFVDDCLLDQGVTVARLARNSLAHCGGRLTPQLAGKAHNFTVVGDEIQVTPLHTKALFEHLKDRVTKLGTEAVRLLKSGG